MTCTEHAHTTHEVEVHKKLAHAHFACMHGMHGAGACERAEALARVGVTKIRTGPDRRTHTYTKVSTLWSVN